MLKVKKETTTKKTNKTKKHTSNEPADSIQNKQHSSCVRYCLQISEMDLEA